MNNEYKNVRSMANLTEQMQQASVVFTQGLFQQFSPQAASMPV
jgi:hypothetical protein